ncbi:PrgH/EprH family type III secretion apparatus protein [Symbiopectobacterium purcellii]|uniref:PrgH/EprH family type III secretion apparatus protein n=1 Tax=Symbiopectobacterium purcellii TaxID=2871826 RepID=UPI003F82609A
MDEKHIDNNTTNRETFTLKILFGPMFGCELNLPADNYFFNIHPPIKPSNTGGDIQEGVANMASFACKTLYIPCEVDSDNLRLYLTEKLEIDGKHGYQVDILSPNNSQIALIEENVFFQQGHIRLALKKHHEEWSEELSTFTWAKESQVSSVPDILLEKSKSKEIKKYLYFFLVLSITFISIYIAWYTYSLQSRHVASLNTILAGSPAPLKIIKSDSEIYVFGEGYQEINWLHYVLYKLNETAKVIPIWTAKTRKEVIKKLQSKGFPVLQLDLTLPEFPQLYTYRKLDNEQEASLKTLAYQSLPYAKRIDVFFKDKKSLVKQAQHGLERIQILYRCVTTDSGFALIIRDDLSDSALNSLNTFITDFYNQWGDQIVSFSINMNENILKDKSYLNTKEGYIFISPKHWYFPLNKKDINYG